MVILLLVSIVNLVLDNNVGKIYSMLDNQNLSIEKTFEMIAHAKDIFAIALIVIIGTLLYLYRYQIKLFLKYGLSPNKKDSTYSGLLGILKTDFDEFEKKDLEDKIDNLLNKFNSSTLNERNEIQLFDDINNSTSENINSPPIFRPLKTIRKQNEILYYFVNDGGIVRDFKINSIHDIKISVDTKNKIESKGSGYFQFELKETFMENEIHFELIYYDDKDKFQVKRYIYSILENKLS